MTLLWKQAVRVPTFIFACSFLPPRLCWSFSISPRRLWQHAGYKLAMRLTRFFFELCRTRTLQWAGRLRTRRAADLPHPSAEAKHTVRVSAISQNGISCGTSFKNCKLNLIAFCSHGSSVIVLCLFFAVTVFCYHSLFLALIVLCIQHP